MNATTTHATSRRPARLHLAADHTPGAHRTDSVDAIWWWTPTLGPTAAIAAGHLAMHATAHPTTPILVADLEILLGVSAISGRFWRTLDRLERFGIIRFWSTDSLTIRTELPALSQTQLDRLPARLSAAYQTVEAH